MVKGRKPCPCGRVLETEAIDTRQAHRQLGELFRAHQHECATCAETAPA